MLVRFLCTWVLLVYKGLPRIVVFDAEFLKGACSPIKNLSNHSFFGVTMTSYGRQEWGGFGFG